MGKGFVSMPAQDLATEIAFRRRDNIKNTPEYHIEDGIGRAPTKPPAPLTDEETRLIQTYDNKLSEFKRTHHPVGLSDITDDLVKSFIIGHRGNATFKFETTDYDQEVNDILVLLKRGEYRLGSGSAYSYDRIRQDVINENLSGQWVAN